MNRYTPRHNGGFGSTEIRNPFPENDGSVHIWQGFKDRIIPYTLNRYIDLTQTSLDSLSRAS